MVPTTVAEERSGLHGFAKESWLWLIGVARSIRTVPAHRRLRLAETLSLGEKRFVAVVEFEHQQFLIAGTSQTVNLLARLGEPSDFGQQLTDWCERQR